MNKNTKKTKADVTWITIWTFVSVMFGLLIFIIVFACMRYNFTKSYVSEVGLVLTGNVDVYVDNNGEICMLLDKNYASFAKTAASGNINFEKKKVKPIDHTVTAVGVSRDDDTHRYIYVYELENGRTRVTVSTENGETTADLDVKFKNFLKLCPEHAAYGDNTPVEFIP